MLTIKEMRVQNFKIKGVEKIMATYKTIMEIGERIKKSSNGYITIGQLRRLLMEATNVHHTKTIKHYMETLIEAGVIKSVNHEGCMMFEIIRK
jgi:hypothetical protein